MRRKIRFPAELSYILGLAVLALGTAFMEHADFGMSMVVAPAYLVHRRLVLTLPFFSFGMAEYVFQALLLVFMCLLLRRFRPYYLLSFVTAIPYGLLLDGCIALLAPLPALPRVLDYSIGLLLCSLGVSFLFHTYLAPEVYELFVKELARRTNRSIPRVKTVYDCTSCLIGVVLSFLFFGFGTFVGVKLGTIVCALVNGFIIGLFGKLLDACFDFFDALPLRRFFTEH